MIRGGNEKASPHGIGFARAHGSSAAPKLALLGLLLTAGRARASEPAAQPTAASPPAASPPAATPPPASQEQGPSDVHGFAEVAFRSAYITPRGLVVTTNGLTVQPIVGIVMVAYHASHASSDAGSDSGGSVLSSVSLVTSMWNDFDASHKVPYSGVWNESDFDAGVSVKLAEKLELGVSYLLFTSPPHYFEPEHNLEVNVAFDDTGYVTDFAVHPYVKTFLALAGDSTVVLGAKGGTYDVELGLAPTYTIHAAPSYPVDLSLATFMTVGGAGFFGDGGLLGVFVTEPFVSVPLAFVPGRLGRWHVSGGVAYYHLMDDNLVRAEQLLGNSDRRDRFVGDVRLGMRF